MSKKNVDLISEFERVVSDRSKSLGYHWSRFRLEKSEDGEYITAIFDSGDGPTKINATLWNYGVIRADARRSHKNGWLWQYTIEAEILDRASMGDVLKSIEKFALGVPPTFTQEVPTEAVLREALFNNKSLHPI